MKTENITIGKGDYGYPLYFTVKDDDGDAYPLTDYTVKLKMWVSGVPGTLLLDDACVLTSPTHGICTYTIQEHDFDTLGRFAYELELTQTGLVESTDVGYITVKEGG